MARRPHRLRLTRGPHPTPIPHRPTEELPLKPGIHPEYRPVVFRDRAAGYAFLTRSTVRTTATIDWADGNTYPLVDVDVSSASHPFWTGRTRAVDTEGRIARFRRRYAQGSDAPPHRT